MHMPRNPWGIVVFVHGSGTTRRDPLNQFLASRLEHAGFATLLVELLVENETRERHIVFDVELQAERLMEVVRWLGSQPRTRSLNIGYFGTGIGAGVVLMAAAKAPRLVSAIVSRGGRPDTVLHWVPRVRAPTLFIDDQHGEPDWVEAAYKVSTAEKELVLVPSKTQLLEEPGAIAVAQHARRWFSRHLALASKEAALAECSPA
jgi:dienelactone hydrolase